MTNPIEGTVYIYVNVKYILRMFYVISVIYMFVHVHEKAGVIVKIT